MNQSRAGFRKIFKIKSVTRLGTRTKSFKTRNPTGKFSNPEPGSEFLDVFFVFFSNKIFFPVFNSLSVIRKDPTGTIIRYRKALMHHESGFMMYRKVHKDVRFEYFCPYFSLMLSPIVDFC